MPKISYMIDERPLRIIFFTRELCLYFMDFSKKEKTKKNTTENPPFYCHALYRASVLRPYSRCSGQTKKIYRDEFFWDL